MLAHKTVGREVANAGKINLKELYSSEKPLAENRMDYIFNTYHKKLIQQPIIYIEEPQNHSEIGNIIYTYWKGLCKENKSYMVVEIDHAVITKGKDGQTQKDKVDTLMETLNAVKKKIASEGGMVFYIVLSQMNRDIKDKERTQNPSLHYVVTSDLFGSSSCEFFSDYILISHMPSKLNLQSYTDNKFPVILTNGEQDTQFIYWHLLKNRDGEPDLIIPMLNNLKYFDFEEVSLEHFAIYHEEFKKTGRCNRIEVKQTKEDDSTNKK